MFPIKCRIISRDKAGNLVENGFKEFGPAEKPLNEWANKPDATEVFPPLSSAIQIVPKDATADTITHGALGYILSHSNDVQNSGQGVALFSSVYFDGHGWSITPDNFHKSMIVFAARKLVKATWLNDRDEFNQPNEAHSDYAQFSLDAVIYALFHPSNQSSSLGSVVYKKKTYDIPNEFFWLTRKELCKAKGLPQAIYNNAMTAKERHVASWLQGQTFSPDAEEVLRLGKEMVLESALHRDNAAAKFQLNRWDAGWAQIRQGLFDKTTTFIKTPEMIKTFDDFKAAYAKLKERLRPMLYTLGFLPAETVVDPSLI